MTTRRLLKFAACLALLPGFSLLFAGFASKDDATAPVVTAEQQAEEEASAAASDAYEKTQPPQ